MFRCKGKDDIVRERFWAYMNKGWVAAITICRQEIYTLPRVHEQIPDAPSLDLALVEGGISIEWTPSETYLTEVQYKIDDGDWVVMDLIDAGVGEV